MNAEDVRPGAYGGQGTWEAPSWRRSLLWEARCWLVVLLPLAIVAGELVRWRNRRKCWT